MWFFRAVALDLDGTLAVGDRVSEEILATIDETRSDRAVLLMTGRVRRDLDRVFPGLMAHFDAVVTENGAVLSTSKISRLLYEPVDIEVDKVLADRGVAATRGEVLLAIDSRDGVVASQVITDLGLDCQVVHNRGSAMILPAGVTKAAGLLAALEALGLSIHNTIAVGDAENDLSLLRGVELGAAVADAVPSVADHADLVLDHPNGAGVVALLRGPLLRGHQRLCPQRRWVSIGWFEDASPVRLPGSQSSVLVSGDTGSGKSYLAGLLAERWIDAGYSVLVIDPEGDHLGLSERADVHLIDAATRLPAPHELISMLSVGHGSVVLDLSGLDVDAQLAYLRHLPDAVAAGRASHGVPHWVVYDEAHERSWLDDQTNWIAEAGTCLVTWRPELLPSELSRTVDFAISVSTIRPNPRSEEANRPELRGSLVSADMTQPFHIGHRVSPHVRHGHKYAYTPLPASRRFYFHGPSASEAAATLEEFSRRLLSCNLDVLDYHLTRGDFSRWVSGTLADYSLATELSDIEHDVANRRAASLEQARRQVTDAIRHRYLDG
jgi:hydroxymethylpyrimidine pyrophosphatase-like HAD family hydrolase